MQIQTLIYDESMNGGWSEKFADLDSQQTLILVFAAPKYIHNLTPFKELSHHYPQSKIIGCSSAGEISGSQILDNSIAVAIIKFDRTSLDIVKQEIVNIEDSLRVGADIANTLDKSNLLGIFVLSDGLNVNGSELVKGLNTLANKNVVITGGLAADGKNFGATWVLYNDHILTKNVVAVGFYGDKLQIGHASRGGWDVFGPERFVTSSKNNILYELDDKPALTLYQDYLGEKASGLPAAGLLYPLAIRKSHNSKQLVRTILAIDEKAKSLTFAGDIPQGYLAQLMRSNFEKLVTSASEAGTVALEMISNEDPNKSPLLAVAISCVGRRLLLGERTEEETISMFEGFPAGTKQIGFYSYGEISPYTKGDCSLHNQTMTVTTFYEPP